MSRCLFLFLLVGSLATQAQPQRVSPNGRYLVNADGSPFFFLGDTAWELFHNLSREEADTYLNNRADKGFTVIQAVVLAELDGLHRPNHYGEVPLLNNDPTQPNQAYFKHIDYVIDKAQALGLTLGLLPTWGDKVTHTWGIGPKIFTPENAFVYGQFLGSRYRNKPLIWSLGGDRNPDREEDQAIWRAMAKGIQAGTGAKPLITYHPNGKHSSSEWFQREDWLSFNFFQSSHYEKHYPNYAMTQADYARQPTKPTLDGEPRYEDHVVRVWDFDYTITDKDHPMPDSVLLPKARDGIFDDFDVRQAAYWSILAGACGFTYGHYSLWMMWKPGILPAGPVRCSWEQALDYPGAVQMTYLRRFFEQRPFWKLVPDQSIIREPLESGPDHGQAARADDESFLLVYMPQGRTTTVRLDKLGGHQHRGYWFNPRTGKSTPIPGWEKRPEKRFVPPAKGRGADWVLVVEDAGRHLASLD